MRSTTTILINGNFDINYLKEKTSGFFEIKFEKNREWNEVSYHAEHQKLYLDIYNNVSEEEFDNEIKYSKFNFAIRFETFGGEGLENDSYKKRHVLAFALIQHIKTDKNFDALVIDDEIEIVNVLNDSEVADSLKIEFLPSGLSTEDE